MVNKAIFFGKIKTNLFKDGLTQKQVDSINAIISECERQGVDNLSQVAYILATAYHECYNPRHPETRLTPIVEFGGEVYLKSKKYYPYYGRGFSQLTWHDNYQKESKRLGIDLLNNPELILDIPTAANSHVYCMAHGIYTGKKLSNYINDTGIDFISARKIVNGKDKAELISGYANSFYSCLSP